MPKLLKGKLDLIVKTNVVIYVALPCTNRTDNKTNTLHFFLNTRKSITEIYYGMTTWELRNTWLRA